MGIICNEFFYANLLKDDQVMTQLPEVYIEQMKDLLGVDAASFLASYNSPRTQGLRMNMLKLAGCKDTAEHLRELFQLEPVPWCPTGYYYPEHTRPGKHPYHQAGLYYIQEPSAMSSVELLAPQPGDVVLDLAAAPGGKSTQIAGYLKGRGLLVANEIHPQRAKALSENIERLGIRNALVTCSDPQQLSKRFPAFFNKIMLDAPCSGEGMFRKDPEAIEEWSPAHVEMCAARQAHILDDAACMLRPGGLLCYSTCTFNRQENEATIEAFVQRNPQFSIVRTERLWPHKHRGEGHFVALLTKASEGRETETASKGAAHSKSTVIDRAAGDAMKLFHSFAAERLPGFELGEGEPLLFGEQLYWLPRSEEQASLVPYLSGLKTLRPGLHLAEVKRNRVEPAHALALAALSEDSSEVCSFAADSPQVAAYLRGESLQAGNSGVHGWTILAVDGFPLGWVKASDGLLKNHYPKGLRR
jgi:16S rRNA C967 or C1407 C5-methylase (RsmB/RsmF family)/NOL1/NOP2/fmu family ribosome biogenesis protein